PRLCSAFGPRGGRRSALSPPRQGHRLRLFRFTPRVASDAAKAEADVPGPGHEPVPVRGTHAPRPTAPRPAAEDTHRRAAVEPRRTVIRGVPVIVVPMILAPFPHVAVHFMQAPRVWRQGPDRNRRSATETDLVLRDAGAKAVRGAGARTAGVFPAGLTRQTDPEAWQHGIQPPREVLGVVPGDARCRKLRTACAEQWPAHRFPPRLGACRLEHPETLGQRHLVPRAVADGAAGFVFR